MSMWSISVKILTESKIRDGNMLLGNLQKDGRKIQLDMSMLGKQS